MDLTEFILSSTNEAPIRLGFFLGIFGAMALWELAAPRRKFFVSKPIRWLNNLGLAIFNTFLLRWLFPSAAVGMAAWATEYGWGLLNDYQLPFWLAVAASLLVLDFTIWLQHVMMHAVPVLWRLHRVHHADLDFDVTTGVRFHPLEMGLSMLIKFAAIAVLGPPIVAVVLFEVLLNATSMFNHSNIRLPFWLDQRLRWFLVTPDMHRVHHSVEDDETNSNFGFNLPWWDRLLGTYRDQPRAGHEAMDIGIHTFRDIRHCTWLPEMLWLPFIGRVIDDTLSHRKQGTSDHPES